jgi:hypothetical protein
MKRRFPSNAVVTYDYIGFLINRFAMPASRGADIFMMVLACVFAGYQDLSAGCQTDERIEVNFIPRGGGSVDPSKAGLPALDGIEAGIAASGFL